MNSWAKLYFSFTLVISLVAFSTDATSCYFQDFDHQFFNHTGTCFADQPILDQFPSNLTSLFLGIPYSNEIDDYLNCTGSGPLSYLPADKMPISGIINLRWIEFCSFNFNDGRAERISPYLNNVKSTLVTIEILYGKLSRLNAGVLRGFTNLKELTISSTGLEYIEPGAFNEIRFNGPALVMAYISLSGNLLRSFDWALLQPIAADLEDIRLPANAMESMQISRPVIFPKLVSIDLGTNNLKTIPTEVLKSWPSRSLDLGTFGNPFCPTDSLCRCCSVRPLWEYALKQGVSLAMGCGPDYTDQACPTSGNTTIVKRKSTCSAGCNIMTTATVDLAQYKSCTANVGTHAMACDRKRQAKTPNGRSTKQ